MRVDVVDRDEQLAESGLADVLGQHLGVAASQLRRRRLLQLRRAAHQIPHHAPAVLDRLRATTAARAARATTNAPSDRPPPAARPATRRRAATSAARPPSTSSTSRGSQVGSASGANAASASAQIRGRRSPDAPPTPTIFSTKSIGNTIEAERHRRNRHRDDRQRRPPAPTTIDARNRAATGTALRSPAARQNPFSSHSRCAPSTAANSAPIDADAAAGDDVDLDAGFVQRAQDAGMIGAGRAGAGQDERGAALRRVGFGGRREGARLSTRSIIRRLRRGWSSSFTISNSRAPPGVDDLHACRPAPC